MPFHTSILLWGNNAPYPYYIYFLGNSDNLATVLFLVAFIFNIFLLIGYRTGFSCFVLWMIYVANLARTVVITEGGDMLIKLLLFWSIFLPLSSNYSVSSRKDIQNSSQYSTFSAGTVAILLQIALVYWISVGIKWQDFDWINGNAVYYSLSLYQYSTPLGESLLRLPFPFLKFLTYYILTVETLGPFFLFFPQTRVKLITIFVFLITLLGFGTCLDIGLFVVTNLITLILFIPSEFWGKLLNYKNSVKLFLPAISSGKYNLINKMTIWLYKYFSSINISLNKGIFNYSFTPFLRTQYFYLVNILVVFFMIISFSCGINYLNLKYKIPAFIINLGHKLGIEYQNWRAFTPPGGDSIWYVIRGQLQNGEIIDVFRNGQAVSWEQPNVPASKIHKNNLWKKYLMSLPYYKNMYHYYAAYLCNDWNQKHKGSEHLKSIEINLMNKTPEINNRNPFITRETMYKNYCSNLR